VLTGRCTGWWRGQLGTDDPHRHPEHHQGIHLPILPLTTDQALFADLKDDGAAQAKRPTGRRYLLAVEHGEGLGVLPLELELDHRHPVLDDDLSDPDLAVGVGAEVELDRRQRPLHVSLAWPGRPLDPGVGVIQLAQRLLISCVEGLDEPLGDQSGCGACLQPGPSNASSRCEAGRFRRCRRSTVRDRYGLQSGCASSPDRASCRVSAGGLPTRLVSTWKGIAHPPSWCHRGQA
jgi:hypothetical protein